LTFAATQEVTVDQSATGRNIVPEFVGLSYESNQLSIPLFQSSNSDLVNLFKRLGPGLLRIGGNSVEQALWDSGGKGLTTNQIAPPDLARLAGFLNATNWKVMLGVSEKISTPATVASEAAAAKQILGDRLESIEIGNEANLYSGWTDAQRISKWTQEQAACAKAAPGLMYAGPASSWGDGMVTTFAQTFGNKILSCVTFHNYLGSGLLATSTIPGMLGPNPTAVAFCSQFLAVANTANLSHGFRLAETNSFYHGGRPGVSNSYASAIWVLDYMFLLATGGANGLNLHGGGGTWSNNDEWYTPINNDQTTGQIKVVRPEYYGVSLFSMISHGLLRTAKLSGGTSNNEAFTIDDTDGTFHVVVINKDMNNSATTTIHPGSGFVSARSYELKGTNASDTSGTTLGGVTIGLDGTWNPTATNWTLKGDSVQTTLAPVSAQLFTFLKTTSLAPVPARTSLLPTNLPAFDITGRRLGAPRADLGVRVQVAPGGQSADQTISVGQ
jgi:hypothetical protein